MSVRNGDGPKRIGIGLLILTVLGLASVPFVMLRLGGRCLPRLRRARPRDTHALRRGRDAAPDRAKLLAAIAAAEARIAHFYGSFEAQPTLLACMTEACDHKLGGRGARATTYTAISGSFIRFAPRGLNETIISHEFSHAELHRRIGAWKLLMEVVPAWFDEGVAVIASGDERYLKPGASGAQRCMVQPQGPLPENHFAWEPPQAKRLAFTRRPHAEFLLWMDANGGHSGLLAALADTASGKRTLP